MSCPGPNVVDSKKLLRNAIENNNEVSVERILKSMEHNSCLLGECLRDPKSGYTPTNGDSILELALIKGNFTIAGLILDSLARFPLMRTNQFMSCVNKIRTFKNFKETQQFLTSYHERYIDLLTDDISLDRDQPPAKRCGIRF
ncbi:MAG: hypothetical protein JSS07_01000 [Proteobacteria bacterium]|nr:hypothetical protein [Pseudomonadota bacterium]